jgi:hypothetical protein
VPENNNKKFSGMESGIEKKRKVRDTQDSVGGKIILLTSREGNFLLRCRNIPLSYAERHCVSEKHKSLKQDIAKSLSSCL